MRLCDPITTHIRGRLCIACRTPCEHQHNRAWHEQACAKCPLTPPSWAQAVRCEGVAPAIPIQSPATKPVVRSSVAQVVQGGRPRLLHILRGWKRADLRLKPRSERKTIEPICLGCDFHQFDPQTGLMACGAGCNCGMAAVSVYRDGALCKLALW